jgi:hypothetical protein
MARTKLVGPIDAFEKVYLNDLPIDRAVPTSSASLSRRASRMSSLSR